MGFDWGKIMVLHRKTLFFLCYFIFLSFSCKQESVSRNGSFEIDFGEGVFPKISNCIGNDSIICVYFSDLHGNIRFAPFSMPNTSTYAFISSEGFMIPVFVSPHIKVVLQNLGLEYNVNLLHIYVGGEKTIRTAKNAVAVSSSGLTSIAWYDENYKIHLLLISDKLRREIEKANFINNYIQESRGGERLISTVEIREKYGSCFDISLYSQRFVSISTFSEGISSIKFIIYDIFKDSYDKDFVEGGFDEFVTKPEKLEIEDFYLVRLPKRTFPSSEATSLDPNLPFGFLDPQNIWIFSKNEVMSVRVRFPKINYVFEDFCSLFWDGEIPGVFVIEKGKLKAFRRRSAWTYDEVAVIDDNIFGGAFSSFSISGSPCVAYQKVRKIFYSCKKDGWSKKVITESDVLCSDIRSYVNDGKLYLVCQGVNLEGKIMLKGFVFKPE